MSRTLKMAPVWPRIAAFLPWALFRAKPGSPVLTAELAETVAANAALSLTVAEIETRFLAISTSVETTTEISRHLVDQAEALTAITHGPAGGECSIQAAAGHIWRSIEFVEQSITENDALVSRLATTREQLVHALATEQELAGTLAPMRFVQSLFRIESARLAPELQAMFQAVVVEIERVRLNVENEFQTKFELIREVGGILNQVIAQLEQRGASAKRSVASLRAQLTTSLQRMQETYEQNRSRDARLSAVSQAVAAETGRVVMSLQFCDTFAQKLQHTRRIMDEMRTEAAGLPNQPDFAGRTLRFVEQSGLICGAQLTAMQAEFVQAGETLRTGIEAIGREMSALDGDRAALGDLSGHADAVKIVLDSLADVQRLVSEAEQFAMESHRVIAPIGSKTTNFTRFIGNLAFEVQLIGLNSEIQANHVGQGTGLEVLSAQTSAISRATSALSLRLAGDFDTLTAGLAGMVTAFEDIRKRSIAYHETLVADAAADHVALSGYRDRSFAVLRRIGELLPQLQTATQSALAQSEFVLIVNPPLARLEKAFAGLANAAKAAADQAGAEPGTPDQTDHFLRFYTMTAEGVVHRRALGQPEPAEVRPAAGGSDVDLFGLDADAPVAMEVELFGDPEPAAAVAAEAPEAPAGEVDLWLPDPAPGGPTDEARANTGEERSAA